MVSITKEWNGLISGSYHALYHIGCGQWNKSVNSMDNGWRVVSHGACNCKVPDEVLTKASLLGIKL